MQSLLILLVLVTMAFGAAASVTISLAPAYADDSGKGIERASVLYPIAPSRTPIARVIAATAGQQHQANGSR